ncbi:hypothetical protein V7798_32135 [Rhizobium laguerreae]
MADDDQTVIEWGTFEILSIAPEGARVPSQAVSPDGRQTSLLVEGLTARIDGPGHNAVASVLVGGITPKIPPRATWSAMRADFRGHALLTNGARATIQLGLGRGSDSQTLVAPLPCGETEIEIVRTLYSDVEASSPDPENGEVAYGGITISIMVTVTSIGPNSAALVEFDSIDVDLWMR